MRLKKKKKEKEEKKRKRKKEKEKRNKIKEIGCRTGDASVHRVSCRASPGRAARRTHEAHGFDVTAVGAVSPFALPATEDKESTMRDGRLTFSLRGTHDNSGFNLVPDRVKSPGNRPVPLHQCPRRRFFRIHGPADRCRGPIAGDEPAER